MSESVKYKVWKGQAGSERTTWKQLYEDEDFHAMAFAAAEESHQVGFNSMTIVSKEFEVGKPRRVGTTLGQTEDNHIVQYSIWIEKVKS